MLLAYRREGTSLRAESVLQRSLGSQVTGFGDWLDSQFSGWLTGYMMLPPTQYGNRGNKCAGH